MCNLTPGIRSHKHKVGQRLGRLSRQSVVVVVGNYWFCSWIYEETASSACTSGFTVRVEAKSPPLWLVEWAVYTISWYSIDFFQCQDVLGLDVLSSEAGKVRVIRARRGARLGGRWCFQPLCRSLDFSRFQSRSFAAARLSCCFLPLARAIRALARPCFQCMSKATRV